MLSQLRYPWTTINNGSCIYLFTACPAKIIVIFIACDPAILLSGCIQGMMSPPVELGPPWLLLAIHIPLPQLPGMTPTQSQPGSQT